MPSASRLALLAALLGGCDLGLDEEVAERAAQPIVNGQATTEFPTVGVLLTATEPASLLCTGTLVGCDRFLTAAHCVCFGDGASCQDPEPGDGMRVYLQGAGFFSVVGQHVHPEFRFPDNDVAVLELSRPAVGLRPSPLARRALAIGEGGTIVGFGRSGGMEHDYGIKQSGQVVTGECPPDLERPGHVCWTFEDQGANTCNGDSGGPLFVADRSDRLAVAGITSGGTLSNCLSGDQSYDTGVSAHLDYIASAAGGPERLGPRVCGELPHVGELGTEVVARQGSLQPGVTDTHQVEVPPGTAELRVSLNATEGSSPDLYLRAGRPATAAAHDCAADGPGSYGYCEVRSPVPGTWHVQVIGVGYGDFQLTATTLAGAPVAVEDAYDGSVDLPLEIAAADGVLSNDGEVGRGALVAELVREPRRGKVELRDDGSFTYTPTPGESGRDSFRYRASDGTYAGTADVALSMAAGPSEADDEPGGGGCAAGGAPRGWAGPLILLGLWLAGSVAARRRGSRSPCR
jgi:Trypsin/Bacterial Ig domain/Bacterial pre-peptidase C-terminal domain